MKVGAATGRLVSNKAGGMHCMKVGPATGKAHATTFSFVFVNMGC